MFKFSEVDDEDDFTELQFAPDVTGKETLLTGLWFIMFKVSKARLPPHHTLSLVFHTRYSQFILTKTQSGDNL